MTRSRFRHASPSMVVACVALLIALGGTGVAAVTAVLPHNSVGNVQLQNNAVTSAKVKNGSLLKADFKAGQIPAGLPGPAGTPGAAGAAGRLVPPALQDQARSGRSSSPTARSSLSQAESH